MAGLAGAARAPLNLETSMTVHSNIAPAQGGRGAVAGMTRDWDFVATPVPRWRTRQTVEIMLRGGQRAPRWEAIRPITAQAAWTVYFLYAPDGRFDPAHRYTLARLRDAGHRLMVVCAAPSPAGIPVDVHPFADALYWKGLAGYDFSAYSAALHEIARKSPHATALVINDSVYGPFTDLRGALENPPWELTGFTATPEIESHIQSYAFVLQDVTRRRMWSLASVMFPVFALSKTDDVIQAQESRFARVAARSMRVGSYWHADGKDVVNPSLERPIELVAAGFPFLKRSLTGKLQARQNVAEIRELLFALGHPVPDASAL